MSTGDIKYLIPADGDELWGLTVTGVGSQVITADEVYPPQNHPQGYFFDVEEGRVLDEFQLLYITDGEGMFTYGEPRVSQRIEEGKNVFPFSRGVAYLPSVRKFRAGRSIGSVSRAR